MRLLADDALGLLDDDAEKAANLAGCVAGRRAVRERVVRLLGIAVALEQQEQPLGPCRLPSTEYVADERPDVVPDLRPYLPGGAAERPRILGAERLVCVGVVAEKGQVAPPAHPHGVPRREHEPEDGPQAAGPSLRRPDRTARPVGRCDERLRRTRLDGMTPVVIRRRAHGSFCHFACLPDPGARTTAASRGARLAALGRFIPFVVGVPPRSGFWILPGPVPVCGTARSDEGRSHASEGLEARGRLPLACLVRRDLGTGAERHRRGHHRRPARRRRSVRARRSESTMRPPPRAPRATAARHR